MRTQSYKTTVEDLAYLIAMNAYTTDGRWSTYTTVRRTIEALGNINLAEQEDATEFSQAYDDNRDNEFWQALSDAGACMHGLTIVSGIDNWQDLLALLERLHAWSWCAWVLEHHEELDLAPGDGIYEEFERLA